MNKLKFGFSKKTCTAIVVYVILLAAVMIMFDKRLQINYYTVNGNIANDTVRLVFLTDFHSNTSYGKNSNKLLKKIEKLSPDIVLLGGDIYDDVMPNDNATMLVTELAEKYRCFFVTGNHEYLSGKSDEIKSNLRNLGVTVLEGDCETININGQNINICGVDDPVYGYGKVYKQLSAIGTASNNGNFTVLLTHRPELVAEYSKYNFDLILAGHTHGGQIRIPYILNGLYAPNQGWFPKYAAGKYDLGDCELIVSRGLDRDTVKIPRMFNRPELSVIDVSVG